MLNISNQEKLMVSLEHYYSHNCHSPPSLFLIRNIFLFDFFQVGFGLVRVVEYRPQILHQQGGQGAHGRIRVI